MLYKRNTKACQIHPSLDVNFKSELAKEAFTQRLTPVRNLMTLQGALKLLAIVLLPTEYLAVPADRELLASSTGSFLRNTGTFCTLVLYSICICTCIL